jgi:hypothetical protein
MTPQAIQNLKNLTQQDVDDPNTLLSVVANPTEDVQLILGEPRNGRDDTGDRVRRDPVKRQEFDAWIRCALFLSEIPDGAIIPTADGDLITDPLLRGNIYLKGLLLHESNPGYSASVTGKPLMFGYNFASGATNRERMSVSSHAEESMFMFRIWNRVLRTKPELVKHLSEMLNSEEPAYADVLGAERHLLPETAARLKDYLCGSSFSRRWYYSAREKSKVKILFPGG